MSSVLAASVPLITHIWLPHAFSGGVDNGLWEARMRVSPEDLCGPPGADSYTIALGAYRSELRRIPAINVPRSLSEECPLAAVITGAGLERHSWDPRGEDHCLGQRQGPLEG